MKFSISSGELVSRLQTMGKVIEGKVSLPILDNFLFSVRGNKLVLTASNSEMRIVSSLEISNEEGTDSDICVPGAKLSEYIKHLPEQPVSFYVPNGSSSLEMSSLSGKSKQACVSAEEYPIEQAIDGETSTIVLKEDVLLSGINHTLFATGNDALRPVMNGIYFDIEPDKISFVATDSHKMARYIRTDVQTNGLSASFTLNKKPANVLKSFLGKTDSPVTITFGAKNVSFETANYKYICRLTEGTYPAYRSVIPANNDFRLTVNRTDFINSLSRATVFVDASHLVKCEMFSNSLRISTQDLDFSCSAHENIPCEYNGQDMAIGFSGRFLVEALSNIESSDVVIEVADPSRPGLISPATKSDVEDLLIIIMPMKV